LYGIQKFVFENTTNMRPLSESPVLLEHPHSFSGLRRSVRNGTRAAVETIQKKLGLVKEEDLLEDENVHPMYGNFPIDPPDCDEKETGTARTPNTHTQSPSKYHPGSTDYVDEKQSAGGRVFLV
jgi:hypothetical protein